MRVLKIFCLFAFVAFTFEASATNVSSYASAWGASMVQCPAHNFSSSNGCLSNCSGSSNGKNMMVARAVNSNGAKFCLTYVNSLRNNSSEQPKTEYHQAVGTSDSSCVWLCKPGYGGDECNSSTSGGTVTSTCDSTQIKSSTYTGKSDACTKPKNKNITCSTSNVESSVAFFSNSEKKNCSNNPFGGKEATATYKMEHDVILAITGWTTSGHGAYVQPTVVWAWCPKGKNDENCKIVVSPQKTKTLLCKDGYKPNTAKSDCEAINGYVCQGIKDCAGWSASRFSGANYNTVVVNQNSGSCTQYRCSKANYGFAGDPATTTTCKECTGAFESVSEKNGQCIEDTEAKKKAQEEAERKANTHAVTYSCGDGSGTAPSGTTILLNNNFTPATNTCTAPTGYSFSGWLVSGTSDVKSAGSAFKWGYEEAKTLTAQWSAGTYSITYIVNGGSNASGNPATYTVASSTITLEPPMRDNSSFVGWYSDSGFSNQMTQIAQGTTGDKTFYAKWSCNTGYVSNSDDTACVEEEQEEPTEPVVESTPIKVVHEDKIVTMWVISKSEMRKCWEKLSKPELREWTAEDDDMSGLNSSDFKECIRVMIGGRSGVQKVVGNLTYSE